MSLLDSVPYYAHVTLFERTRVRAQDVADPESRQPQPPKERQPVAPGHACLPVFAQGEVRP